MFRATIWGILVCAVSLAVSQPVPAAAQVSEAWDKVKAFTVEKKDAALDFGRGLVRDTDAKIKDLETKAEKSSGETKAAYERSIADLKVKRAQAASKLDEMGKATGSAWDATKNGFAEAYKDLKQAVDKTTK